MNPTILDSGFKIDNSANEDLIASYVNTDTTTDRLIRVFTFVDDINEAPAGIQAGKVEYDTTTNPGIVKADFEEVETEEGEKKLQLTITPQAYTVPGSIDYYLCLQTDNKRYYNKDPKVKMETVF
jgi:hypothetical protein